MPSVQVKTRGVVLNLMVSYWPPVCFPRSASYPEHLGIQTESFWETGTLFQACSML